MVGAEQKCATAGVGVGVGDFPGAAPPTTDWDTQFKRLHTHMQTVSATASLEKL